MARFRIDQGDTGPVGQSRHDLVEGQEITLEVIDPLPEATYYWELLDHVGAPGAVLTANGTTATIGPAGEITSPCTFLIRLYGDGHTEERVASVRAESGVRYPAYGEKAPKEATLGNHDPDDATDNAWYPDLAGHGPGQNWAGWREWAREMVDAVEAASNQETDRLESDSGDAFVVASDELEFTEGPGSMLGWSGEILGTQMFAAATVGRTEDNHPYVGLVAGDPESENNSSSLLVLPHGIFTQEGELATQLYVDERAGHTITGVSMDWTDPNEPVPVFTDYPKRGKLIITTDMFEADVQDMEEIDATVILLPSSGGGGSSTTLEDSYGSSFAQIRVTSDLESGWGDDFPTLGQGSVGHFTRIDGAYNWNIDHHASLRDYGGYDPGNDILVSSTRLRHWDQSDPLGGEQHVVNEMRRQAGTLSYHVSAYNFRGDEPYSSRWQREMATTHLQVNSSGAANTLSVVDEAVERAGIRAVLKKGGADAHPGRLFLFDQEAGELELKDLATKGYVDSRPGAEGWSEHAATQDVDLDGHKLTGLGEPTDASDAATKAYVDSQSGGGGGGTPGHVICNVVEDDPPIEPVPQRANLVFFSDTSDVVVTDFEELDTTIVNFSSIPSGDPWELRQSAPEDPNENTYAQAGVSASYYEEASHTGFHIHLSDHNNEQSYLNFDRQPDGERFVIGLGYQPGDLMFEVNDHTSYGDKEFRLRNAPTLIETPTKPAHAATKAYVDSVVNPNAQSWQQVTAQRAMSTVYTNTTGRPIIVAATIYVPYGETSATWALRVGPQTRTIASVSQAVASPDDRWTLSGVVPNGWSYSVDNMGVSGFGDVYTWMEYR